MSPDELAPGEGDGGRLDGSDAGAVEQFLRGGPRPGPPFPRLLEHPTAPVIATPSPADPLFDPVSPAMYTRYGPSALVNIELAMMSVGKRTVTSILDVPSGHGRVLRTLRAAFPDARLTACDPDEVAVEFCNRTFGARPVHMRDAALEGLPSDEQYDLIWTGLLFTHAEEERWHHLLELLTGVLAPEGLLVFSTHGRWIADQVRGDHQWFGIGDEHLRPALQAFDRGGFGHAEHLERRSARIALASPAWVASMVTSVAGLRLLSLIERGWVGTHDVVSCQRGASGPVGQWFHGRASGEAMAVTTADEAVQWRRRGMVVQEDARSAHEVVEPAVVEGRDGWLFLRGDTNRVMEQSTGELQLTPSQLRAWMRLLENRVAWTSSRGVDYHFFIAPNKESVYPEHLPEGYCLSEDRIVNRLLAAFGPGAPVDYPVDHLRLLAAEEQLYSKGDTHWNYVGAFHAYRRWVSLVSESKAVRSFERVDGRESHHDDVGDLGSKCVPERPHLVHGLVPARPSANLVDDNGVHNAGRRQRWRNRKLSGGPKLLVFHDSFFGGMVRFWAESFGELVAVHSPLLEYEVVEDEAPDVVLSVMVERFLILIPDDVLGRTSAEVAADKLRGTARG